ncbi:hypothetical protein [Gelidibacter salicanalis]|uniref:Uncharacterized protein n=1 Tax=Gelidibacter salicanalis TaxID=291193 RepID=A0A934NBG5_9FLAO|nr:hypothetical protein [Gelidibacter salicanalis]MBJ7879600.1 hypothetical protein [Gelidibacter salicanalis]
MKSRRIKITTFFENINFFGGLNSIPDEYDRLNLRHTITSYLGKRSVLTTYQYSDIIKNIWILLFAGGDCAEDIHTNLKSELSSVLGMSVSSPDMAYTIPFTMYWETILIGSFKDW